MKNAYFIFLVIVGIFIVTHFSRAVCRLPSQPQCLPGQTIVSGGTDSNGCRLPSRCYLECTEVSTCSSWGVCTNGTQTCDAGAYTLSPANCTTGSAPTQSCTVTQTQTSTTSTSSRTVYGYAWSDNVGYISFSGNIVGAPESCTPDSPLSQTLPCPPGESGEVVQTRTSTCPGPVTSDWVTVSNTCSVTCVPDSPLTQTLSCPSGQTGSIIQTRTSTCPGPITSVWTTTSNTCIGVPGAPTNVVATAGNTQATVSFGSPSSDGGAAISSYTVTSNPGGITKSSAGSPIIVTGLTNNTSYSFIVKAINSVGAGASATSNSVTPTLTWSPIMINTWYYANSYCTNPANGYERLPTASELSYAMTNNIPNDWPTYEQSSTYWRWWTSTLCTSGYFGSYPCTGSPALGGVITGYAGWGGGEYPLNANLSTRFRCVK